MPGNLKSNPLQQAMLLMMAGAMGSMCKPNRKSYPVPIAKPKSKKYNANHP